MDLDVSIGENVMTSVRVPWGHFLGVFAGACRGWRGVLKRCGWSLPSGEFGSIAVNKSGAPDATNVRVVDINRPDLDPCDGFARVAEFGVISSLVNPVSWPNPGRHAGISVETIFLFCDEVSDVLVGSLEGFLSPFSVLEDH